MKQLLIRYRFKNGVQEEWHREIARFISAVESDPALRGRISYRAMKGKEGDEYFHLVEVADDQAVKELGERDYFVRYTEKAELASDGGVEVLPLEVVAQTQRRA